MKSMISSTMSIYLYLMMKATRTRTRMTEVSMNIIVRSMLMSKKWKRILDNQVEN